MPNKNTTVRILIADDHELYREGFQSMMKNQSGIEIVGEAKNGKQLLAITRQLQPDIVFTDIHMPEMDGIEATREIIKQFPAIGVVALSMLNEENLILDMLAAGAKGYILKSSGKEEVLAAVKAVQKGHTYYCRDTDRIISGILVSGSQKKPKFSDHEIMVIKLICQQLSSPQIAQVMNLSTRTIEGYREKIMEKMKVKNPVGIALYAVSHKLYEFRK